MGNILNRIYIDKLNKDSFKKFTLKNIKVPCKIINIYDGDTLTIGCRIWNNNFKIKVRMYGYDSPELRPKLNILNRISIIEKAIDAKNFLANICHNKKLFVEFLDMDKYGRPLANIYIIKRIFCSKTLISVNDEMIKNGHGYSYFGGKKKNIYNNTYSQ